MAHPVRGRDTGGDRSVCVFARLEGHAIAALTLPLSIFPAFWVMELLGFSLNMVTLLAITLSTGILVDDAIVEIENIVRHIRMGKSPYQAAPQRQTKSALQSSPSPLPSLRCPCHELHPSVPGQFLKQFGITVSVQVLFSPSAPG